MLGTFDFNQRALTTYREVGFREIGRRQARIILQILLAPAIPYTVSSESRIGMERRRVENGKLPFFKQKRRPCIGRRDGVTSCWLS